MTSRQSGSRSDWKFMVDIGGVKKKKAASCKADFPPAELKKLKPD